MLIQSFEMLKMYMTINHRFSLQVSITVQNITNTLCVYLLAQLKFSKRFILYENLKKFICLYLKFFQD